MDTRRRGAGDAAAARARRGAGPGPRGAGRGRGRAEDRFARVVEGDGELAELLRGTTPRGWTCAATRRVTSTCIMGGGPPRSICSRGRGVADAARHRVAPQRRRGLALFEGVHEAARPPERDEKKAAVGRRRGRGRAKDEEQGRGKGGGGLGRLAAAEDEKTIRLIQQAARGGRGGGPDASASRPGRCYHPRGRCAAGPARGPVPRGRAGFDGLHKREDNGRARSRLVPQTSPTSTRAPANRHGTTSRLI